MTRVSNKLGNLQTLTTVTSATLVALLPFTRIYGEPVAIANSIFEYRITDKDTLPFGSTYVRAEFYLGADSAPHLKVLRPATPDESPNAFLKTIPGANTINTLISIFLEFWNTTIFTTLNKNIGNKIGEISGYYLNKTDDTIIFKAKSADFGSLGQYDILQYYSEMYYVVSFRNPYLGGTPIVYMTNPSPKPSCSCTDGSCKCENVASYTKYLASWGAINNISYLVPDPTGLLVPKYYVQEPTYIVHDLHMVRFIKFTLLATIGTATRAEIARIGFYTVGTDSKFTQINAMHARVSVQGILEAYDLPPYETACKDGYNSAVDPLSGVKYCEVTSPTTYPYVANTACALGFMQDPDNTSICTSTGYFQELLNTGSLLTGNSYTSRLHLPVGNYVLMDFNSILSIDAFSLITGSQSYLPLQWKVEGSINGLDWVILHNQSTSLSYANPTFTGVTAFYNPGIFQFSTSTSPAKSSSATSQSSGYNTNVAQEGFTVATPTVATRPTMNYTEPFVAPISYTLPLEEGSLSATKALPKFQELKGVARLAAIRFKVLETQNPDSPFVHMSMLQFHTKSGIVPPECIQISNQHGSRRSAANRPEALLSTTAQRWVDYNKSELLVQFKMETMPADPVTGIRFYIPTGVATSVSALDAFPAKWKIEGSYDRRTWFPLHEKLDKARILGGASPVYQFLAHQ